MNSPQRTRLLRPSSLAGAMLAFAAALAVALGLALSAGGSHHARVQKTAFVAEAPDPLAAQSFPNPAGASTHAPAAAPSVAAGQALVSPGAPSLSQVEQQLKREHQLQHDRAGRPSAFIDPGTGALAPGTVVPLKVAQVIAAGNAIADFPYVYGGGHATFIDRAYDCSGSVSYALAAAGLIRAPETSGQLEHWGVAGQGRYVTVFANAGHAFMNVDGVWFDTAGRSGPYSTRWLTKTPLLVGYAIRHPPGL